MRTKTWLEAIENLDPSVHDFMLQATAYTFFRGELPPDFAFLGRILLNLGFEHLDLEAKDYNDLLRAFASTGVVVPNTEFRLRFVYPHSVVELADGTEQATLPKWWKEGVLVSDDNFIPTWVG